MRLLKASILLLAAGIILVVSVNAQNRTRVELWEFSDQNLEHEIEANASEVLTALNIAYPSKVWPVLPEDAITPRGKETIRTLWEAFPFQCLLTLVKGTLEQRMIDGLLQLRNIRLTLQDDKGNVVEEEGVLLFDREGRIDGLYFGLEEHRYAELIHTDLSVNDRERRKIILDFVEDFRTAYNRRDIDFLSKVISQDALILVGRVLENSHEESVYYSQLDGKQVEFIALQKEPYLKRLNNVFAQNEFVHVEFDEIEINAHPAIADVYGVTLIQAWRSSSYRDQGYLFLMIDFKDESQPVIHVRIWYPEIEVNEEDKISLEDFYLRDSGNDS